MDKTYLIGYITVNLAVFLLYGYDKFKAKHDGWRIPEKVLLLSAVAGILGALAGMTVFHHKTKKKKFYLLLPLILILEAVLFFYFHPL
ncbi:MAG: DUF1294 domain-containing protein [Erysipelotrichaceae bacterium]|nr:DUF1294 domain-containing protein [Erysipelotrichaceae bacterium]